MKKLISIAFLTLVATPHFSFPCDTIPTPKPVPVCTTCPAGPQGEPGIKGNKGDKGDKGDSGIGAPGQDGKDGKDGKDGTTIYREDSNADAGIAGAMAMARIGHARLGGEVVGLGLANFDGENAIALGFEKSWKTNTRSFNEVSAGVAGFVSGNDSGIAGSVNLHF